MEELTNSLTWAYEQRRLLLNEEKLAMVLNPQPFLWLPDWGDVVDAMMIRDSFFFVLMPNQWEILRNGQQIPPDRWQWYSVFPETREEKRVGSAKNQLWNRQAMDVHEVAMVKFEV